jgi:hypothetical protein
VVADKALDGTDPWMSAWERVRTGANDALDIPLQSVTDDDGSHYFTLDRNDRHDYREAIETGDRVRNLALAHFVTGEDRLRSTASLSVPDSGWRPEPRGTTRCPCPSDRLAVIGIGRVPVEVGRIEADVLA